MKIKAVLLIVMVAFTAIAASSVLGLSISQMVERNAYPTKLYGIVQIDGNVTLGPNGEPIDGPGMPTYN